MPLSLWGLDDARKNFNDRVDKTGSAAWSTARGRKPKDENDKYQPPRRTSTSTSTSTSKEALQRERLPPPRKLSQQDLPPPPKTPSADRYAEAKSHRPPPPPLPSRTSSEIMSPNPSRSTSTSVPKADDTPVRPSELLNRTPTFPATIQRNESQDGVTNELAEKLARMRTRSQSPGKLLSPETTNNAIPKPVSPRNLSPNTTGTSKPVFAKPVSPKPIVPVATRSPSSMPSSSKPPPLVIATKPAPNLPPRTTPVPPRVAPLKSAQSAPKPAALPYTAPSLHRGILPEFIYPTPDKACASIGLDTFNRLFPQPLWELEQASLYILAVLYPSDAAYTFTPKTLDESVSLIMRDMDGNAHAENSTVIISSGGKKQYKWRSNLVFSTRNLTNIAKRGDAYFLEEVRGVIVHELTHSWQWSASNTPGGLIEGIADFVRLRSGLAPKHWNKSPKGKQWDAGYDTTAYFLDYVDREIYPGFVACINEWLGQECLRDGAYDEERMFAEVMPGWSWNVLWELWCETCQ